MTPERWQQIRGAYEQIVALAPGERASQLDLVAGDDSELRQEVESLLSYERRAQDSFLDTPVANLISGTTPRNDASVRTGRRLGVYELIERIGYGGMGEVYRAARIDGQYQQEVAVKLVRSGYDSTLLLERFRHERQILATLDHPNIARLLDGGTTEDGIPYLVMELIDGVPIDRYCLEQKLSIVERLKLFRQVCAAVHYAHQHLVVHRDLKPSNILVTANGVPKLLDFGIAKILDPSTQVEPTLLNALTPEYASPEQLRGESITTAADVYSLGVVLYRLLTGHSPYSVSTTSPADLARAITEVEPERPSSAVLRATSESSEVPAKVVDIVPGRWARELRGDLDMIVLKALRKEPQYRYSSVEQLSEDIRRHLENLPVKARRGSTTYRLGKFLLRHRIGVAAAALVTAAIAGGVITTVREARIADRNAKEAEKRFNEVRKLANSLIFEVHDSIKDLPGANKSRKVILERAVEYLDSLAKESASEPDLVRELATAYERIGALQGDPMDPNLGEIKAAQGNFIKSIELREALARTNPHNSKDQIELAVAYLDYSDFQTGVLANPAVGLDYCNKAVAILDREADKDEKNHRVLAQSTRAYTSLGFIQIGNGAVGSTGDVAAGVTALKKALELDQRAIKLSPSDSQVVGQEFVIYILLGDAMLKLGEPVAAENYYRSSIEGMNALPDKDTNIRTAGNLVVLDGKMADVFLREDKISDAVIWYRKAHDGANRLIARDPADQPLEHLVITSSGQLGHALMESGQMDAGLEYMHKAFNAAAQSPSQTPLEKIFQGILFTWFGEAAERKGRLTDAVQEYRKSQAMLASARDAGANDLRSQVYYTSATDRLAAALLKLGNVQEASSQYTTSRDLLEPLLKSNPDEQELLYAVAETYAGQGDVSAQLAKIARKRQDKVAHLNDAVEWFQRSSSIWSKIKNPSRVSTSTMEVRLPTEVSRRLTQCKNHLAEFSIT
jgi:non-specific serine/threonine protein kinase/serine/threonine-protein kinase